MLNYLVNSTTINFVHARKASCQSNKKISSTRFTVSKKFIHLLIFRVFYDHENVKYYHRYMRTIQIIPKLSNTYIKTLFAIIKGSYYNHTSTDDYFFHMILSAK